MTELNGRVQLLPVQVVVSEQQQQKHLRSKVLKSY